MSSPHNCGNGQSSHKKWKPWIFFSFYAFNLFKVKIYLHLWTFFKIHFFTGSLGLKCRECEGGLCSSSSDNGAEKECDSGYNACIFSEASKLYFGHYLVTLYTKAFVRRCWSRTSSTCLWVFTRWTRWMSNSRSGRSWSRILLLHSRQL